MREYVGGRDGVLNCEIDANTADGRHCVRGVADAEEARAIPLAQAIDEHREQFDLIPVVDFARAVFQEWGDGNDVLAKSFHAASLDLCERAFANYEGALPILFTIQHHQNLAGNETSEHLAGIARLARNAKPQHVDWRSEALDLQTSAFAHSRLTSITTNRQGRAHLDFSRRRRGFYAHDVVAFN